MTRKICVVTGSRAEYGLLRPVIAGLRKAAGVELQLVVTGAHLSPEFGLTYREIDGDGFTIHERVEMLLSGDTPTAITKSMGVGTIGFADVFARRQPDLLVLLGDRYEVLAAASAATLMGIPIAHINGGETTEGAFDEAIRHAVTKMSHLHFVAAEPYRRRVVQLGEDPKRVFDVGGLGVDAIKSAALLDRTDLEASLGMSLGKRSLLVTFHPVTLEGDSAAQMGALLSALGEFPDIHLVFTMPNADVGSRELSRLVDAFVAERENARAFTSLGQLRYLSCMRYVDGVVGNSSSGLAEAPSFGIGTVNIGDRQRGRLKAGSVIDCAPTVGSIAAAIETLYSEAFRAKLSVAQNPYGNGGAGEKIVKHLTSYPLAGLLRKSFWNIA